MAPHPKQPAFPSSSLRVLRGSLFGILLSVACLALRFALDPWLGNHAPFAPFLVPVFVAAWAGGWIPGLFTAVVALCLGTFFFVEPRYSWQLAEHADEWAMPVMFLLESTALALSVHFLGVARQKAVQLALSEGSARADAESTRNLLQLTTNHVPAAIAYVNAEQRYVFLNETFRRWWGSAAEGKTVKEVLGNALFAERASYVTAALSGRAVRFEGLAPTADGEERLFSVSYTPDRAENGRVRGFTELAQDVTEQRAGEERFLQLTENLVDTAFYVVDYKPRRISYVSPAFGNIWGLSRESVYDQRSSLIDAVHEQDRAAHGAAMNRRDEGEAGSVEYRVRRADGTERWVIDRYFPIRDRAGRLYRSAGIVADITERKLAEMERQRLFDYERRLHREAEEHRRRLYSLFLKVPGAIAVITGPENRFEFTNDSFCRLMGKKNLEGQRVEEVFADRPLPLAHVAKQVIASGQRFSSEEMEMTYDWFGEGFVHTRYFNLLFEPILDAEGKRPIGVMNFTFDITALVTARKALELSQGALQESERGFRDLSEAVPHLVWTAEPDGRPVFFNRRWLDYLGVAPQESFGGDWSRFIHREDVARARSGWTKSLRTGVPFEEEVRLLGKDNSYRWHLIRATAARDPDGRVLRWYGTVTDIEELREAMNARDRLLSICSHELRTPVTAMKLQSQLARRAIDKGEEFSSERIKTLVERTDGQLVRLARLIDEMLDFSRLNQGKFLVTPVSADLSVAVAEAADRMRLHFEAKGVPLKIEVEPGLRASFDALRLEQVISNLLDNALKYGEGKPVGLEARASADGAFELKVVDFGAGIAPEYLGRIFEPYERALSPESITGLGMGLYIARQIIQAHHGEITVQSAPRHGTVFKIRLPLEARMQAAAPAHAIPTQGELALSPPSPSPAPKKRASRAKAAPRPPETIL